MDLTVLELHLHDVEFNAPFSSGRSGDDEPTADPTVSPGGDLPKRIGPIGALVALVGLALLARYLRGGEAAQSTADEVEA